MQIKWKITTKADTWNCNFCLTVVGYNGHELLPVEETGWVCVITADLNSTLCAKIDFA